MTTNRSIHDYEKRFERFKHNIKQLPNSQINLQFLDHLGALGLSVGRLVKYASHLPVLLRIIGNTNLKELTKADVERVVANINGNQNKVSTKHDKKLALRKLVQYVKTG